MLNNIAIGTSATLDMQTRTLTRLPGGESVTLPASACLCLEALAEARGEVLSQEQLMDIGWRSAGVEVTENSVRVMINKLRRALNQLELQDAITLLAVTRSGYRLIIREEPLQNAFSAPATPVETPERTEERPSTPATAVAPPSSLLQPEVVAPQVTPPVRPRHLKRRIIAGLCGLVAGVGVAMTLHTLYVVVPEPVTFIRWSGPDTPPDTEVMVEKGKQDRQAMIEATLRTYQQHVLNRRPNEKPARVLYVTLGEEKNLKHLGLIACQQPLQDAKNDCESFYFRFY